MYNIYYAQGSIVKDAIWSSAFSLPKRNLIVTRALRSSDQTPQLRYLVHSLRFQMDCTETGRSEMNYREVSQKVRRRFNEFLCLNIAKQSRTLPPGRFVSLCFDDFPQSAARNAAPLIEARDWRATWYVSGSFEGTSSELFGPMFDRDDLQRLHQTGHEIGCHTYDHVSCAGAETIEIKAQCQRNQGFLKANGLPEPKSFAFPFGAVDLAAKSTMSAAITASRSIAAGTNRGLVDVAMLKACGLQGDQGGVKHALNELRSLEVSDGWLIIFTHDVRQDPSPWGVTPNQYGVLLEHIEAVGAEVLTVSAMIERLDAQVEFSDGLAA